MDPLAKSYPQLSTYQFASNSPIANIDLDGAESQYYEVLTTRTFDSKGKLISEVQSDAVKDKSKEAGWFVHGSIYTPSGDLGHGTLITSTRVDKTIRDDGTTGMIIYDEGALYIPSIEDRGRGGLYFVSSNGSYTHSSGSLEGDDAIPIKLDLLVSAVGGFPKGNSDPNMFPWENSGDEVSKLAKLPSVLISDKKFFEKVDKLLAGVKALVTAGKSGDKIGKAVNEMLEKSAENEEQKSVPLMEETKKPTDICSVCGATMDSGHINSTVRKINSARQQDAKQNVKKTASSKQQ